MAVPESSKAAQSAALHIARRAPVGRYSLGARACFIPPSSKLLEEYAEFGMRNAFPQFVKNSPRNPTLAAVAQRAGVSKMTASRALRNTGRVSAETIRRVTAAAKELGYRPNPLVQTLMAGVRNQRIEQSVNIAWTTTFPATGTMPLPVQAIEDGARERALELGYELVRFHIDDAELTETTVRRIFEARGIRAAVIGPMQHPGPIPNFPFGHFPMAAVGRSLSHPALHYTMAHHFHAMDQVLRELVRRGYQRIGFLQSSEMDIRAEHGTQMVFEHHCLRTGMDPRQARQFYDGWRGPEYLAWFETFLPDVIIVDSSPIFRYLAGAGVPVGAAVGVATLSWQAAYGQCTGIRQPYAMLGSGAVDLVVAQLHRNEWGIPERPKAMLFGGEWVEGNSLRRSAEEARCGGRDTPGKRRPKSLGAIG